MGLPAVDHLLLFLVERKSRVAHEMMSVGFSEHEMRDAWGQARAAGFTESTGLGQDRLTEQGRTRANALR